MAPYYIRFIILVLMVFGGDCMLSQDVVRIIEGQRLDSSFYTICQVTDNEFWVGGEEGIIKSIDTLGNMTDLPLRTGGLSIIKMKKFGQYVYLTTSDAIIYRYDIKKKKFLEKKFEGFSNRCFYDIIQLYDGRLMVCGGSTALSQGRRKIPNGFVAVIEKDFSAIKMVWKSRRKFVWTMIQDQSGEVLAATFNGLNTYIISSTDLTKWSKKQRVKGLVYDLSDHFGSIWYCGSSSTKYRKNGVIGCLDDKDSRQVIRGKGCLWRLIPFEDQKLSVTYNGELIAIDHKERQVRTLDLPRRFSLYALRPLTKDKLLVVGSGMTAYLVNINEVEEASMPLNIPKADIIQTRL